MIFEDQILLTKYDIGNYDSSYKYGYSDLAKTICDVIEKIDKLCLEKQEVKMKYLDNNNNTISITGVSEKVRLRTKKDITDILKRTDTTSIAKYLMEWGINEPEEEKKKYNYFQLLYLFYMVQYVVFPDDKNVLNFLEKAKLDTDASPVENASNGKFFSLMLDVLLEDDDVRQKIEEQDYNIELHIGNITKVLDKLISSDNPVTDADLAMNQTPRIITETRKRLPALKRRSEAAADINVLVQAADYIYKYLNKAFAHEMITNLRDNKQQFFFGEIEETLSSDAMYRKIDVSKTEECMRFLEEKEVVNFYRRGKRSNLSKNTESFISNVINDDLKKIKEYGYGRWIRSEDDIFYIYGMDLALLMRAFCDLGSSTKYKMNVKLVTGNWEREIGYRKTLTTDYPNIVMNYFYLAYESEKKSYNTHGPGGFCFFFVPLCLEKVILIQEIMQTAFDIDAIDQRIEFLLRVLNEIIIISQELE